MGAARLSPPGQARIAERPETSAPPRWTRPDRARSHPAAAYHNRADGILRLQHGAGNRAVQRLLTARAAGARHRSSDPPARSIVRSEPAVQRTCACGGACADCRTEPAEAADVTVARLTVAQLQRPPGAPPKRRDVALVGADFPGAEELARVLAPGGIIVPVSSVADVAVQLARLDVAIGTLYFVSHSAPDGALKLSTKEGLVKPGDVATALRGKIPVDKAPQHVDFRGCKVGGSPPAMDQIRAALGARSLVAGDCWIVVMPTEPIVRELSRKPVTKASDVEAAFRPRFLELLKRAAATLGPAEACIVDRSERAFFRAGGRFIALFFNPAFVDHWVPGKSVCYGKLSPQTVDPAQALAESSQCRLIQVEKPAVNAPSRTPRGVSVPP